jgi:hypothetical protein
MVDHTINSKFLGYFWDLAAEDEDQRLGAANGMLMYLSSLNSDSSEIDYALKRLIKGLGSSREAARQGFAVCLCELLKFESVSYLEYLKLLDENTKVTTLLIIQYDNIHSDYWIHARCGRERFSFRETFRIYLGHTIWEVKPIELVRIS